MGISFSGVEVIGSVQNWGGFVVVLYTIERAYVRLGMLSGGVI